MTPALFVPDASVLLKWVLRSPGEEGRDQALRLRSAWVDGTCAIVVPTLWVFEVANVLGQKHPAGAEALLSAMVDLRMPEEAPSGYLEQVFRLMRDFGVTAYDAAYHGLAVHRGGTMVTADRRYARKAADAGCLQLLDDWGRH